MKQITLQIISDPGHAWCKVPITLLNKLGIQNQISRYSYKRKDHAYLEEDLDLTTLIDSLNNEYPGIKIKYNEQISNKSSKIRSYIPYTQRNIFNNYTPYSGL
jgi:hypothetical protein